MVKKNTDTALKVIPLGGLHEIGKNTCVFEYGDEIILIDAGLAFPTDGMHGVNLVLPDITYLKENQDRIKGMIVTHGHEDHIGGIAFHLKQFDIPVIYGPKLALALLSGKLDEAGVSERTELRTVGPRDTVRLGKNFLIEFIRNTHSMADSFTLAIRTPVGVVIFTGDFKIDHTPVDGEYFDLQKLAEYGEQGVLCLFSDSTNSEVPGFTPSEAAVYPNLEREIAAAKGRVFVTTFASSVHRVNMILDIAGKLGKKVAVVGRSMLNVIEKARNLGYVRCKDELFIPLRALRNYDDKDVLILTTGSQGEELAALSRISRGEHQQLQIKAGDTVIFSANPIPGNTISVVNTIDRLMQLGAHVVYGKGKGIHVSGHGCQEDQKLMLSLTRPKFFVPVHGEHRMLIKHSQTAQSVGVSAENIVIVDNGDVVELTPDSIRVGDRVASGIELVDGSRQGMVDDRALKERQQLAADGIITAAAMIDGQGKLARKPEVQIRGLVGAVDRSKITDWITKEIEMVLRDHWSSFKRDLDGIIEVDWIGLQGQVELGMQRRLRRELQSRPMTICVIQPLDPETMKSAPESVAGRAANGTAPTRGRRSSKKPVVNKKRLVKAAGNGTTDKPPAVDIPEVSPSEVPTQKKTGLRRRRSSASKRKVTAS